ncbi:hypothetical protein [Gymnodinialimonas ceratoperidinii]|uniref:Uncharacterized protein n=1 Tax=Gymnodinialimonas ceratoperidinii TaxID=2856823 RepID=A0A8F6YAM9_9RHOB|nr:hypothetical protein [Gymnodinialimonas ceratoperidinii]QXT39713.1 hypothetical protein KYE46_00165 [Gymnodinialimonas ceratoperidinii]
MRITSLATAALLAFGAPAQAFMVAPCGPEFTPLTITEPWEEMSRTFANGAIRVFEIFIDPNVASGAALGILHPIPASEGGPYRTCTAIYAGHDHRYFGQAYVSEATAVYDASLGLIVTIPVSFTDGSRRMLRFAVNQATGVVSLL